MIPLGLYIHIPFCMRKCAYCDFVSYAGQEDKIPQYFQTLQQELVWYLQQRVFDTYQPHTLYIGGGTPSLATQELIIFFRMLHESLVFDDIDEITIEVNPGTITLQQFQQLRQAGIDRVSIGVQSLNNTELHVLGRIHTCEEALQCFSSARQTGFQNINLDLMFGIPGSRLQQWRDSLQQAISLHPEHISMYDLTIEEGTLFWQEQQQGKLSLPDEETQLEMYETGIAVLQQAGYEHYEISNFALPGYRSQHNQIYWRNEDYLGLGAGAYSYLHGRRYWNFAELEAYIARGLATGCSQNMYNALSEFYPLTVEGEECLNKEQRIGETVMMNLRMIEGISLSSFQQRFGRSLETMYAQPLEILHDLGLVEITKHHLRLTPKGILFSNEVFQEFLGIA